MTINPRGVMFRNDLIFDRLEELNEHKKTVIETHESIKDILNEFKGVDR